MFDLIKRAPMSDRVRGYFVGMVDRGDPEAIMKQLRIYLQDRGDIGASVRAAGLISFETVFPQVEALYEQWKASRR